MAQFITPTGNVNTPTVASNITALAANLSRQGWFIQNQDTAALKVLLGTGASATVYHIVLKASTGAADGSGGTFGELNGTVFTGPITVFSAGTPSYTIIEH